MKELNVHCNIYVKVDDNFDVSNAYEKLAEILGENADIQIYEAEIQDA